MSDVKTLFRSPTPFSFVDCNTLLFSWTGCTPLWLLSFMIVPWSLFHHSTASLKLLGSSAATGMHFPNSLSQALLLVPDLNFSVLPFIPETSTAPFLKASSGLSQCQALAVSYDHLLPSKSGPPGWLWHLHLIIKFLRVIKCNGNDLYCFGRSLGHPWLTTWGISYLELDLFLATYGF